MGDQVEVRSHSGSAYYGNGEAACYSCWSAGKILLQIGGGEFYRESLSDEEVLLLVAAAEKHLEAKPTHNVRVDHFARAED